MTTKDMLLDQTSFALDAEGFARLQELVDSPPPITHCLRRALTSKARWDLKSAPMGNTTGRFGECWARMIRPSESPVARHAVGEQSRSCKSVDGGQILATQSQELVAGGGRQRLGQRTYVPEVVPA